MLSLSIVSLTSFSSMAATGGNITAGFMRLPDLDLWSKDQEYINVLTNKLTSSGTNYLRYDANPYPCNSTYGTYDIIYQITCSAGIDKSVIYMDSSNIIHGVSLRTPFSESPGESDFFLKEIVYEGNTVYIKLHRTHVQGSYTYMDTAAYIHMAPESQVANATYEFSIYFKGTDFSGVEYGG